MAGRARRLPEWLRLSSANVDNSDYSKLILLILRRLDAEYPKFVDLSDCNNIRRRIKDFDQLWAWLVAQELVTGTLSNCSLTLSGREALNKALQQASNTTRVEFASQRGIADAKALRLLVSVLRQHYNDYLSRKGSPGKPKD